MRKAPTQCRNCGGRIDEGHVVDEGYGLRHVSRWQAGAPKAFWWGGIKANKESMLNIRTYRCDKCGLLEQYAN